MAAQILPDRSTSAVGCVADAATTRIRLDAGAQHPIGQSDILERPTAPWSHRSAAFRHADHPYLRRRVSSQSGRGSGVNRTDGSTHLLPHWDAPAQVAAPLSHNAGDRPGERAFRSSPSPDSRTCSRVLSAPEPKPVGAGHVSARLCACVAQLTPRRFPCPAQMPDRLHRVWQPALRRQTARHSHNRGK